MRPSRVLVTGGSGRLGACIVREFGPGVVAPSRSSLDLTDPEAVKGAVQREAPDLVVNCAAFNDVDGAESQPLQALAVNAFAVRSLARAANRAGAMFVHYSTDFVFDGTASEPYTEEAAPEPQSTYGASKLLGEWFALDVPRALVLRVESLFGLPRAWNGPRGTLDGLVHEIEQGRPVRVFTDRVVSPSYMADVAAATRHLVERDASGLYHCVNAGSATWFDVAAEAARLLRVDAHLQPVTLEQVALKAARPRYCALSPARLAAAGFEMPSWRDALARWLATRHYNEARP